MQRLIAALALGTAVCVCAGYASAFCGFYVAMADAKLFNKASKVVVARDGRQTSVTMASDYTGDPKDFAIVIPVPTVVSKEQIRVVDPALVDHLDAYSAPRLVEYHDADPCAEPMVAMAGSPRYSKMAAALPAPPRSRNDALGVTIEAQYTVGEYDIVILSATQSDGLATWLTETGYKIPAGAAPVLGSYIKQDMKFFVAKVNLGEQARSGARFLRPVQVSYETGRFMLPIRLGTVNASGPQDMIVMMVTEKGRVETTNYRTARVPSNVNVPLYTKETFGSFYKAMFDRKISQDDMRMVYLEYAWDMGWCDPCAADPLSPDQLLALGATWLGDAAGSSATAQPGTGQGTFRPMPRPSSNAFITRLHVRYDSAHFPEDLMFQETADRQNFQARYVLNHPFTGAASCPAGTEYRRSLGLRFDQEATALENLTGWPLEQIKRRMAETGEASPH